MADYPTSLWVPPTEGALMSDAPTHLAVHNEEQDELAAVQSTLGTSPLTRFLVNAKGDLLVGSAPDQVGRVPVGANGRIPVADSAASLGIAWKGGTTLLEERAGDGTSTVLAFTVPGDYQHLLITGSIAHNNGSGGAAAHRLFGQQFNDDAGTNYGGYVNDRDAGGVETDTANDSGTVGRVGFVGVNASPTTLYVPNYAQAGIAKSIFGDGGSYLAANPGVGSDWRRWNSMSRWISTAAITRIELVILSGGGDNWDSTTRLSLYGLG